MYDGGDTFWKFHEFRCYLKREISDLSFAFPRSSKLHRALVKDKRLPVTTRCNELSCGIISATKAAAEQTKKGVRVSPAYIYTRSGPVGSNGREFRSSPQNT